MATTTGTGFLDPRGVDPVEYVFNGDTAIAGVQYSYLPSWLSLLADKQAVRETSRVVFDTVHQLLGDACPRSPGRSCTCTGCRSGSYGVEQRPELGQHRQRADRRGADVGAAVRQRAAQGDRGRTGRPARPPWQPIYREGRTVRFTAEQPGFDKTPGPWGPTRLVYLQHNSDPVVFFSPDLAFQPPDWLVAGPARPGHLPARWAGSRW